MNCKLSNHLNRKYCFFLKDASPVTFIISSFQNSVKVTKRLFQQFSWKQANPAHFNFNESRFNALYTIIRNRLRDNKLNIKINISGKRFTKWGTDWAQSKIIQSRFYIRFNTISGGTDTIIPDIYMNSHWQVVQCFKVFFKCCSAHTARPHLTTCSKPPFVCHRYQQQYVSPLLVCVCVCVCGGARPAPVKCREQTALMMWWYDVPVKPLTAALTLLQDG